jgi:hypothetical protein
MFYVHNCKILYIMHPALNFATYHIKRLIDVYVYG